MYFFESDAWSISQEQPNNTRTQKWLVSSHSALQCRY